MSKPIVFFDLETTGKSNNPDEIRIIEISARKVDPDTLEEIAERCYYRCNPDGVAIAPDATKRHGVTEEELAGYPTFREVAGEVFEYFQGCDIGGYYSSVFDIPILYYSFLRSGYTWDYRSAKNFDIWTLYRKYHSGELSSVYKAYTGNSLENAHEADADVMATIEVYRAMKKLSEVFEENDLDYFKDFLDISRNFKINVSENGEKYITVNFGKWKETNIKDVPKSYFEWMLNGNFPPDTKYYVKKILEKM